MVLSSIDQSPSHVGSGCASETSLTTARMIENKITTMLIINIPARPIFCLREIFTFQTSCTGTAMMQTSHMTSAAVLNRRLTTESFESFGCSHMTALKSACSSHTSKKGLTRIPIIARSGIAYDTTHKCQRRNGDRSIPQIPLTSKISSQAVE
jgi:hypothetical protein